MSFVNSSLKIGRIVANNLSKRSMTTADKGSKKMEPKSQASLGLSFMEGTSLLAANTLVSIGLCVAKENNFIDGTYPKDIIL
jgi:hypothetical protein